MPSLIHPTAVIEPGAQLGVDVEIGAFAYVGPQVVLGDRTRVHHHASVEGKTSLGEACEVFPYACLGGKTQDLKFKGGQPGVRIGQRNVFREYVTVHAATQDGHFTVLGDDNVLLAYGHVAHDCQLGNHIVASNAFGLAGHVVVEDHVTIGGMTGVHQFCRIGAHAMLGGYSRVVQDVAPFMIVEGAQAAVRAFNKIGLERRGFTPGQIERVKALHRILFRDGLNRSQALEKLAAHADAATAEFQAMITFATRSERGLTPGSVLATTAG